MNHDALERAVAESRSMVAPAVEALCDVIAETTGTPPDAARVEFVGLFWLMHLCDRIAYERVLGVEPSEPRPTPSTPGAVSARSRLLRCVGSSAGRVAVCEPYLKMSSGRELRAVIDVRRTVRWMPTPRPSNVSAALDSVARSAVARGYESRGDLRTTLRHRIALSAPVDLVEQHHELAAWAGSVVDPRLRIVYTANAHQSSTSFRYAAFAQRRIGTRLLIHQHGGGYGIDGRHLGEDHDVALADTFLTWGWTRADRDVRPLPTAFPDHDDERVGGDLLLMSLPVTGHFYRLQPFVVPHHVERAVEETLDFVGGLAAGTRIRVRSSGPDVFPLHRVHGADATVVADDGRGTGARAASRASLVVHNYLGTSWLETLAMDVPTICFFDASTFAPRDSARPFLEALARVGVIHHSGADAARFLVSLNGDPSGWWGSSAVREAREAFVARFANFSDDWLGAWRAEFDRQISA